MIRLAPLTTRTEQLLAEPSPSRKALLDLYQGLIEFRDEVELWADDQPTAWSPELVGYVLQDAPVLEEVPWICSGPVEKYFDSERMFVQAVTNSILTPTTVYVATAWNSWRSMHMVWLDQLFHVSKALGRNDLIPHCISKVDSLVGGLKASIPYHLSRDVEEYVKQVNVGKPALQTNHLSGGLLLFHHLYSIGRCTIVDASTRQYLANTLRWIGNEMGIGSASVLADCLQPDEQGPSVMQSSNFSFMDALEGFYLITASMMSKSM